MDLQTQLSGRLRLVITRTFPSALAIGIAQHTIRGTERPLVPIEVVGVGYDFDQKGFGCWDD